MLSGLVAGKAPRHEGGAERQRPLLQVRIGVGGDEDDRQVAIVGHQRIQLIEDAEAVEVRHVEVEQHQIGPVLLEQRSGLVRLRRGDDTLESRPAQQPVDDVDVLDLVVHREDARLGPRELGHAVAVMVDRRIFKSQKTANSRW